jgi:hypothetical protein
MAKRILQRDTSFLQDTYSQYLWDNPNIIQKKIEVEKGYRGSDPMGILPYTLNANDLSMGYDDPRWAIDSQEYMEVDPLFSWVEQAEKDNIEEYLTHISKHNPKNKLQYEVIKETIDGIAANGRALEATDRFWGPMIAAQFMQGETYALLPFTFGYGIGITAAVRGFAKLATLNMISEIPREAERRYYDPFYNETHSTIVFGLTGAIGGLMGAMPPIVRGGLRGLRNKRLQDNPFHESKSIPIKYDDMSNEELMKSAIKEYDVKFNGGLDLVFDLKIPGVSRNVAIKTVHNTGKYIDLETGLTLTSRIKKSRRLRDTDLYVPIKFTDKNGVQTIEIDDVWMETFWQNFSKLNKGVPGIPAEFNKTIKTKADFQQFLIRKEIYRDLEFVENLPKNAQKRELILSAKTMGDIIEENKMSFQTEDLLPDIDFSTKYFDLKLNPVNLINRMFEKFTPLTKYNNSLKSNPRLYFKSNHLIGSLLNDNGVRLQAKNKGININDSVAVTKDNIWGRLHNEYVHEVNHLYRVYLKGYKPKVSDLNESLLAIGDSAEVSASRATRATREAYQKTKNKLLKKQTEILRDENSYADNLTIGEFRSDISRLMADTTAFEKSTIQPLKDAIHARRQFYKTIKKGIETSKLMGYETQFEEFAKASAAIKRLKEKIKNPKIDLPGNIARYKLSLAEIQKRMKYLDDIIEEDEAGKLVLKAKPKEDISEMGIMPMNETDQTFFHRIHNPDAWINNPEQGLKVIANDMKVYNPNAKFYIQMEQTQPKLFMSKLLAKYRHIITREAAIGDELNMIDMGADKKINPAMHRTLYGPNKSFMAEENGGIDFILRDALEVDDIYSKQMGTAIEMKKMFGDRMGFYKKLELEEDIADLMPIEAPGLHAEDLILGVRPIKKAITGKISNSEINGIMRTFEDQVFNLYGLHNRIPSDQLTKRSVEFLMNWTVSDTMGNAGLSGMAEMARRTTVHGFGKAGLIPGLKGGKGSIGGYERSMNALNTALRDKVLAEQSWYYTHMEVTSSTGYMSRMISTDMGIINKAQGTNIVSKTANWAEQTNRTVARATYIVNGQSHLTYILKNSHAGISSHRFIEDLLSLHRKTLSAEDILRLKNYGLGEKHAKIMNDLDKAGIIQKVSVKGRSDLFLANPSKWGEVKGGNDIFMAYQNAIKMDVERSIVTPNFADKPNMMTGKIQIDNQIIADFLGNSKLLEFLNKISGGATGKFHALSRGGLYENALLMFPLQFYTFSAGAQRKIFRNLATERNAYVGVSLAMIYMHIANYFKYGWFHDLDWKQKMYLNYQTSGVAGYWSDVPRMIETETKGAYSIQKLLGIEPLPWEQEEDRRGASLMGIGPSKIRDLSRALNGHDKHQMVRNIGSNLPWQNQVLLKRGWHLIGHISDEDIGRKYGTFYDPILDWSLDYDRDKNKKRYSNTKKDRYE